MERKNAMPNTKLGKTAFLNLNNELKSYIPDTVAEDRESLHSYLQRYRMVYVKPNNGTGGRGVMRVRITPSGKYNYRLGKQSFTFTTYGEMYKSLHKITSKRGHLVQKGIRLLKYDNRPFDIRIMIQKNREGEWENTGIIGRVAHPAKVVTNYHSGGTPLPLPVLLKPFMNTEDAHVYISDLNRFGLQIAKYINTGYPHLTAVGVDVGIDATFKPWIIEVNTKPDPYIFQTLKDKSMFRNIIRLIRFNRSRPSVMTKGQTRIPPSEASAVRNTRRMKNHE